MEQSAIKQAADWISNADALLIGAGAGMGVDSGLPDFRGVEGFWRAYPQFRQSGLSFVELAQPHWFTTDPEQAWGFYGHRYQLYRQTEPHQGFSILHRWLADKPLGGFIFTSNVDGHFSRAGFSGEQILECHGSIHHLQCVAQCGMDIWPADVELEIDNRNMRAQGALPSCPNCGALARPNILMFGDGDWQPYRTDQQFQRYQRWLQRTVSARRAVIELGAGTAVPTVRWECERATGQLIRINPSDYQAPAGAIAIDAGALEALVAIQAAMNSGCGV